MPGADEPLRLARTALGTVAVALLMSQFTHGRPVALVLSLGGAVLAVLSLLGLEKRAWIGWTGVGVNAFLGLLLVAFPGTLGLSGWWPDLTPAAAAEEWVDAGDAAWEYDGVRVGLTFATIAPDPAVKNPRGTAERYLWIGAVVTNTGSRELEFVAWDTIAPDGPILTTGDGTQLPGRRVGKPAEKVAIAPGKSAQCLLVFDAPPGAEPCDLQLQLPPGAFRGTIPVPFRISRSNVTRQ